MDHCSKPYWPKYTSINAKTICCKIDAFSLSLTNKKICRTSSCATEFCSNICTCHYWDTLKFHYISSSTISSPGMYTFLSSAENCRITNRCSTKLEKSHSFSVTSTSVCPGAKFQWKVDTVYDSLCKCSVLYSTFWAQIFIPFSAL